MRGTTSGTAEGPQDLRRAGALNRRSPVPTPRPLARGDRREWVGETAPIWPWDAGGGGGGGQADRVRVDARPTGGRVRDEVATRGWRSLTTSSSGCPGVPSLDASRATGGLRHNPAATPRSIRATRTAGCSTPVKGTRRYERGDDRERVGRFSGATGLCLNYKDRYRDRLGMFDPRRRRARDVDERSRLVSRDACKGGPLSVTGPGRSPPDAAGGSDDPIQLWDDLEREFGGGMSAGPDVCPPRCTGVEPVGRGANRRTSLVLRYPTGK